MAKRDILEKVVFKGFKGAFSGKQKSINNFS
jgi:ribosome modulation factor